jgi:hypothetical protein
MASIRKRGKHRKTYHITVSLGRNTDGSQHLKTTTFTPPDGLSEKQGLKAAKEFAQKFEADCRGLANFDDSMTLNELTKWYFDTIAPNKLRAHTLEKRRGALSRHTLPNLGGRRLRELTPARFEAHLAELRNVAGLSPQTINNIRVYLSAMFTAAVKKKMLAANPLSDVDALRVEAKKQPALSPEQVKTFILGLAKIDNIRPVSLRPTRAAARPCPFRVLSGARRKINDI